MEAIAQCPPKLLSVKNDIEARKGFRAVPLDAFDDTVLDDCDEAGHAHRVETEAG